MSTDQSRSIEALGAALYGDSPPAANAPAQAPAAPSEVQAERTLEQIAAEKYPQPEALPAEELPPEVAALRDADPGRRMYDDATPYKHSNLDKALTELGIEGQEAAVEHRTWAGIFQDVGLTSQDATDVVQLALANPTDEEQQAWPDQAQAALRETYGGEGWRQALADAQLLVRRDPRLQDFLNRTGLGDHPALVKLAAQRARAALANGTLKRS